MPEDEMKKNYCLLTKFKYKNNLINMSQNMNNIKLYRNQNTTENHLKLQKQFYQELGNFASLIESLKFDEEPDYKGICSHLKYS